MAFGSDVGEQVFDLSTPGTARIEIEDRGDDLECDFEDKLAFIVLFFPYPDFLKITSGLAHMVQTSHNLGGSHRVRSATPCSLASSRYNLTAFRRGPRQAFPQRQLPVIPAPVGEGGRVLRSQCRISGVLSRPC